LSAAAAPRFHTASCPLKVPAPKIAGWAGASGMPCHAQGVAGCHQRPATEARRPGRAPARAPEAGRGGTRVERCGHDARVSVQELVRDVGAHVLALEVPHGDGRRRRVGPADAHEAVRHGEKRPRAVPRHRGRRLAPARPRAAVPRHAGGAACLPERVAVLVLPPAPRLRGCSVLCRRGPVAISAANAHAFASWRAASRGARAPLAGVGPLEAEVVQHPRGLARRSGGGDERLWVRTANCRGRDHRLATEGVLDAPSCGIARGVVGCTALGNGYCGHLQGLRCLASVRILLQHALHLRNDSCGNCAGHKQTRVPLICLEVPWRVGLRLGVRIRAALLLLMSILYLDARGHCDRQSAKKIQQKKRQTDRAQA